MDRSIFKAELRSGTGELIGDVIEKWTEVMCWLPGMRVDPRTNFVPPSFVFIREDPSEVQTSGDPLWTYEILSVFIEDVKVDQPTAPGPRFAV